MTAIEAFQFHEALLALLLIAGLIPITIQFRQYGNRWFFSAYLLFAAAGVLTVLESVAFPHVVNLLEHVAVLGASVLFWVTAYKSTFDVLDVDATDMLDDLEEVVYG